MRVALAVVAATLAACGDTTAPNPTPSISSISPGVIPWMSPSTDITVRGSNFVGGSIVLVNGTLRHTTFVSSAEVRATLPESDFLTPALLQVNVHNPSPGGGRSATMELDVRLPPPALTGLSVTTTVTGQSSLVLRLTGTGFTPTSVAYASQAPRTTTWIDWRTLDVVLTASDLASPRVLDIAVMNPGPNGGPTPPLLLHVVEGAPVITELPSRGATAGGGGFALSVHGRAFAPTSTVLWNGDPRPTEFVSRGRLVATISASDVASTGTAQVTVATPAPGGGTSNARSITVRARGSAAATSVLTLPLRARDIAGDTARSRIYLSMPSPAPVDADHILAVDPATGAITNRVHVGGGPERLALSDDGQYLYAGLDEVSAIRRVVLSSFTASLQWSLPAGQRSAEILVLPGRPNDVVVASSGLTVFDNGVARGQPGTGAWRRLAILSSPDTVYSFNDQSTGFEFRTFALGQAGANTVSTTQGLMEGFGTRITGAAGRVYGTDGSVVDPGRLLKMGSFAHAAPAAAIGVDAELGRAFLLSEAGISVYDVNTFALLGTVAVSGLDQMIHHATSGRIVRWGEDGLAFVTLDAVYVVRSALLGP